MNIEKIVRDFLNKHQKKRGPLLLALSGGTDSLALFHLLVNLAKETSFALHVAHVDHGWREASRAEAALLQTYADEARVPFHLHTLPPPSVGDGNLEALARKARYTFFHRLALEIGAEAVLLAHHADDQAESVLKRLFEGATLPYLSGMLPVAIIDGLALWRPLLEVPKEALTTWIAQRELTPFDDVTNRDERFLRARLRQRLIPNLEQHFGKKIRHNLCRLGENAAELRLFVEGLVTPYLNSMVQDDDRWVLDLSQQVPASLFLVKAVVKAAGERAGVVITRELLSTLATWILTNSANKACTLSGNLLYVHKRRLSIVAVSRERFVVKEDADPVADICVDRQNRAVSLK